MSTKLPAASRMASSTWDGMSDPPSRVRVASALITRRMPSRSYTPIATVLSSHHPVPLCPWHLVVIEYEWACWEARTDLCPLVTATDHTYIIGRFPFPPDRRPGPHTGPPIPRRPGPVRGVCMSQASIVTPISTLGICCVEGRVRGVAEDDLSSFRPCLPVAPCNRATTKLAEATSRVDVAHWGHDPLAGPARHARLRPRLSVTTVGTHSTNP